MSEMIERAAHALAAEMYRQNAEREGAMKVTDEPFYSLDDAARAVLLAIREPSKEMLSAGIDAAEEIENYSTDTDCTYRIDTPSDMPFPVWQAMIDAALAE